jgi:hypothetical protein
VYICKVMHFLCWRCDRYGHYPVRDLSQQCIGAVNDPKWLSHKPKGAYTRRDDINVCMDWLAISKQVRAKFGAHLPLVTAILPPVAQAALALEADPELNRYHWFKSWESAQKKPEKTAQPAPPVESTVDLPPKTKVKKHKSKRKPSTQPPTAPSLPHAGHQLAHGGQQPSRGGRGGQGTRGRGSGHRQVVQQRMPPPIAGQKRSANSAISAAAAVEKMRNVQEFISFVLPSPTSATDNASHGGKSFKNNKGKRGKRKLH